jgi:hypothetical protein
MHMSVVLVQIRATSPNATGHIIYRYDTYADIAYFPEGHLKVFENGAKTPSK